MAYWINLLAVLLCINTLVDTTIEPNVNCTFEHGQLKNQACPAVIKVKESLTSDPTLEISDPQYLPRIYFTRGKIGGKSDCQRRIPINLDLIRYPKP